MIELASFAATKGWVLRSGAARGADEAFEKGCDVAKGEKQIFLPWKGFHDHKSEFNRPNRHAFEIARTIHPVYSKLTPSAKKMVARNMYQVLGITLNDPVKCVICYTPDGCESYKDYNSKTGGTGTAIKLASTLGARIFNLYHPMRFDLAKDFLENY